MHDDHGATGDRARVSNASVMIRLAASIIARV
jgi:hypothetical protein